MKKLILMFLTVSCHSLSFDGIWEVYISPTPDGIEFNNIIKGTPSYNSQLDLIEENSFRVRVEVSNAFLINDSDFIKFYLYEDRRDRQVYLSQTYHSEYDYWTTFEIVSTGPEKLVFVLKAFQNNRAFTVTETNVNDIISFFGERNVWDSYTDGNIILSVLTLIKVF